MTGLGGFSTNKSYIYFLILTLHLCIFTHMGLLAGTGAGIAITAMPAVMIRLACASLDPDSEPCLTAFWRRQAPPTDSRPTGPTWRDTRQVSGRG